MVPFTLSMVVLIIPTIKRHLEQENKRSYTKYEVYELFVNDYMCKRIASIPKNPKYSNAIIQRYG
jgi:hypothetical protein